MSDQHIPLSENLPPRKVRCSFLTGTRRSDLLAFTVVLLLMLLAGYRLRVYYFSPPARTSTSIRPPFTKLG